MGSTDSLTLRTLLKDQSIAQVLADTETKIRQQPLAPSLRWLLFQVLCLSGKWDRALKQLPMAVQGMTGKDSLEDIEAEINIAGTLYRHLVNAEIMRESVFAGMAAPEFIGKSPEWALSLVEALALEAIGDQEAADERRGAGLAAAPAVAGRASLTKFEWIADADSRLGPVCEAVIGGRYYWVPFDQIQSITMEAPVKIIDMIWAAFSLTLNDGRAIQGHMPVRYPGVAELDDALKLARKTEWREQGSSGVFGSGQKMWMYDQGESALLEIREAHFDATQAKAQIEEGPHA